MESASFYDHCYAGHFLAAPAVFQSLELCGSTGNDVCGFGMYSGYRCCDSADIASELGGYVPGAKKLLHSVWIVSVCICHGMQIFLPWTACASQYAQSRRVQTECTCDRSRGCRKPDHQRNQQQPLCEKEGCWCD